MEKDYSIIFKFTFILLVHDIVTGTRLPNVVVTFLKDKIYETIFQTWAADHPGLDLRKEGNKLNKSLKITLLSPGD